MGLLRCSMSGKAVALQSEHVVGRLPSCNLPLTPAFVSNTHALIRWTGQSWELRDLGSTNGTTVNGSRVMPGGPVRLKRGASIMFGGPNAVWELVDDGAPCPIAIPVGGGKPRTLAYGVLAVPGDGNPLGIIYPEEGQWFLELENSRVALTSGQHFFVGGREWIFECPLGSAATVPSDDVRHDLDSTTLIFGISRDEEHVVLQIQTHEIMRDLGERSCFYLALILARQRLNDKELGITERGWLDVESLLKMVPDYSCCSHLNVEIHRLRRVVYDAGILDAVRIIERRRGQVRIGTERIELRPVSDLRA